MLCGDSFKSRILINDNVSNFIHLITKDQTKSLVSLLCICFLTET